MGIKKMTVVLLGALTMTLLIGGCNTMQDKQVQGKLDFPTKPVNFIVGYSAGGGSDLQARALEKVAAKHLGQPLVIMNKPGGSGSVGWNELIGSAADGYTVGLVDSGMLMLPLYGKAKYDYPTALEPIAQFSESANVLVVKADSPWQSLQDIVNNAKNAALPLKFGHGGVGCVGHIIGADFAKVADINLEQVPFRSGGEAISAVLGGHIQIALANPAAVKEQVKAGKLRALGVAGEQRLADPELNNIPTFKEQGYAVVLTSWRCVAVPKNLPAALKADLEKAFTAMILDPEFKTSMANLGLEVNYLNAADTQKKWQSDAEKLEKMLRETGILQQIQEQRK